MIILNRGYIFSLEGHLPNEELLTPQELAYQLFYIEKWCQAQDHDGPGLGALTVADRTVWANNRTYLKGLHPDNAKNLDLIENSVGVYAFEDSEPQSQSDVSNEKVRMKLDLLIASN